MDAELRLSYEPDDQWLSQLHATVRSGTFAGQSSAWFDRIGLKERFVAALRAFPLDPQALPTLRGGTQEKDGDGGRYKFQLGVAISPYDGGGRLLVRVELATPFQDSAEQQLQHTLTARFLTEYSAIGRFAQHLDRVLDGEAEQATLSGFVI